MPDLDPTAIRERVVRERVYLAQWDNGSDWNPDGSLKCRLCGHSPCSCGVPRRFRGEYEALRNRYAWALSMIKALLDERDERALREQDERARFMEGPPYPTE